MYGLDVLFHMQLLQVSTAAQLRSVIVVCHPAPGEGAMSGDQRLGGQFVANPVAPPSKAAKRVPPVSKSCRHCG